MPCRCSVSAVREAGTEYFGGGGAPMLIQHQSDLACPISLMGGRRSSSDGESHRRSGFRWLSVAETAHPVALTRNQFTTSGSSVLRKILRCSALPGSSCRMRPTLSVLLV